MINVLSAQKVLNQSEIKSRIPRFDETADEDPNSNIKQDAVEKQPYDMTEVDKIIKDASLILTNSNNQNNIDINK